MSGVEKLCSKPNEQLNNESMMIVKNAIASKCYCCRTNGRTLLQCCVRLSSVCLCDICIAAKRCVLWKKLAYY